MSDTSVVGAAGPPRGDARTTAVMTLVVPACDEEAVIARCLSSLTRQRERRIEVVVVCNGCTDRTADIVRSWIERDPRIRMVELAQGSKTQAIRAGIARSAPGCLGVVDADVTLSEDAVAGLCRSLAAPEPRIAAPAVRLDLTGCSSIVRRFYTVWMTEPYVAEGLIGAGVYAVNAMGRSRLAAMPDVLADDAWARARFGRSNRCTSTGVFTVYPARSSLALIRRRARVLAGNRQLAPRRTATREPGQARHDLDPGRPAARTTGSAGLLDRLSYRGIGLSARMLVRWRTARGTGATWGKDLTSRRTA